MDWLEDAISRADDAEEVLRLVIEHGCADLGARQGLIVMARPDGVIHVAANYDYPEDVLAQFLPMSVTDRLPIVEAVRSAKPVFVESPATRDERFPELNGTGAVASASLPLIVDGIVVGGLGLTFDATRTFSDDERRLLDDLARVCSTSVDRLRVAAVGDQDGELLANLVDASSIGVIRGEDDRILQANDAFLAMLGYRHADLESGELRWTELTPEEWKPVDDEIIAQMLSTGTSRATSKEYVHRLGHPVPVLVAASLVSAEPFRWIALVVDLTEQKRAEQQATDASNQLDAALRDADAARALAAMARELEAAQRLAQVGSWQWASATDQNVWSREMFRIHCIDEPTDPLTSDEWLAFLHPDGRATHVAQRTAAVERGAPMAYEKRILLADGTVRQVVVRGEPIRDADGRVVGVRGTSQDVTEQREAEADLARTREALFLTELQRRQDHGTVEALQQAVLPEHLPDGRGFEVGACYNPAGPNADIGGDWYDCFELDADAVALAVGDVAGHGLGSAALMVQLRNALRAYAVRERSPSEAVRQLNQFLIHLDTDSFATLVYAVYQPSTGSICWTHAGHPPALRFSADHHSWLEAPGVGGPVLGVWADATYPEATTVLEPGEGVLLFSDGLIERRGALLQDGLDRLAEAVVKSIDLHCQDLCDGMVEVLFDSEEREDDVCQLVLRRAVTG
ncbi:MAG: SpoIIE family protein phosphatase [Acidimicrobiales bacterium]